MAAALAALCGSTAAAGAKLPTLLRGSHRRQSSPAHQVCSEASEKEPEVEGPLVTFFRVCSGVQATEGEGDGCACDGSSSGSGWAVAERKPSCGPAARASGLNANPAARPLLPGFLVAGGDARHAAKEAFGRAGIVVGRRLNVSSSEKDIYDGLYQGAPCVLCFAKWGSEALRREAGVLRRLQGCPHVIKLLDFIEEPEHCMVLERVEPLGHDLIEVVTQQTNSGRPMPLGQVRCYMLQLAHACEEMGSLGVVHRDLKPDNVLVDGDHTVKVIDFGLAAVRDAQGQRLEVPPGRVRNLYGAPEINEAPAGQSVDLWGLGMVLYTLCVGMNASTAQVLKWAASPAGVRGSLEGVHPGAVEAIEGLLRQAPSERWGLERVKHWACHAELPEPSPPGGGAPLLQRWPYRDMCPQAFGAQLPPGWARSGETIGTLDLMRIGGLQVLLVDRYSEWQKFYTFDQRQRITTAYRNKTTNATQWHAPANGAEEPVGTPNASTVLHERDWIYFGVNNGSLSTDALKIVVSERLGLAEADGDLGSLARRPSRESLIQFLPEFLFFEFPPHCVNAVLGQGDQAQEGQNALDLRRVFGINVAGVVSADGAVSWWPGASEAGGGLVSPGDGALVLRVPQWDSGSPVLASVRVEDVRDLMDAGRFRARMGLDRDPAAWREWRRNAKMRVLLRL